MKGAIPAGVIGVRPVEIGSQAPRLTAPSLPDVQDALRLPRRPASSRRSQRSILHTPLMEPPRFGPPGGVGLRSRLLHPEVNPDHAMPTANVSVRGRRT